MKFISEFKSFAVKGNVVDMAVGIIIGTAFGKIVSSLVNDILMPPLGLMIGGVDFKDLKLILKQATENNHSVSLNYGNFLQVVFDFIIIAATIFIMIKAMNSFRKKEDDTSPKINKEEQLLTEIRDLLKK